jgi:hypothetical protein
LRVPLPPALSPPDPALDHVRAIRGPKSDPEQALVGALDVPTIDVAGVDGVDHGMSLLEEHVDTVGMSACGDSLIICRR